MALSDDPVADQAIGDKDAPDLPPDDFDVDAADFEDFVAYPTMEDFLRDALAQVAPEPGVEKEDLEAKSLEVLAKVEGELRPEYDAMRKAEEFELDVAQPWYVTAAWILTAVFSVFAFGVLLLLALLFVAKLLGFFEDWSYRPWLLVVGVAYGLGLLFAFMADRLETRQGASQQVAAERKERRFRQQLLADVIEEAKRELRRADWSDPDADKVVITTSSGLSARIDRSARVLTESYETVRLHLDRERGSTVGLSGPRGAGKSELLEEFCNIPGRASTKHGGTIGVLLSTPTAFTRSETISLTIRRLCEKVPGYSDPLIGPRVGSWTSVVGSGLWVVAGVAVAVGIYLTDPSLFGVADMERRTFGWLLIAIGLGLLIGKVGMGVARSREMSFARLDPRFWLRSRSKERSKAAQMDRQDAADYARRVAKRTRFTETRTTSGEASGGIARLSAKVRHELRLTQIPLTEADLVDEFGKLVKRLTDPGTGYEIVIGIDELDKLKADEVAEDFLNGLKSLFAVRDCSFLVSVSESAWGKFAQRGILLRDTFDSSLDAIVILVPPSLSQARVFLKMREPHLTDSQILFCYCLSGGIPRDLIRAARRLGQTNLAIQGEVNTLAVVGKRLLDNEARDTIDAALLNARALPAGRATSSYEFSLEKLRDHPRRGQMAAQMLLEADPDFAALVRGDQTKVDEAEPTTGDAAPEKESDGDRRYSLHEQQRRTLTYLWFLYAMESAFSHPYLVAGLPEKLDPPTEDLVCFLELAKARRRLETSPASAWIIIDRVSRRFGLKLDEDAETAEDDVDVDLRDEAAVAADRS